MPKKIISKEQLSKMKAKDIVKNYDHVLASYKHHQKNDEKQSKKLVEKYKKDLSK